MVFNVNLNSIFVGSSNFVIVIIVSLGVIINFVISNVIIFILINQDKSEQYLVVFDDVIFVVLFCQNYFLLVYVYVLYFELWIFVDIK